FGSDVPTTTGAASRRQTRATLASTKNLIAVILVPKITRSRSTSPMISPTSEATITTSRREARRTGWCAKSTTAAPSSSTCVHSTTPFSTVNRPARPGSTSTTADRATTAINASAAATVSHRSSARLQKRVTDVQGVRRRGRDARVAPGGRQTLLRDRRGIVAVGQVVGHAREVGVHPRASPTAQTPPYSAMSQSGGSIPSWQRGVGIQRAVGAMRVEEVLEVGEKAPRQWRTALLDHLVIILLTDLTTAGARKVSRRASILADRDRGAFASLLQISPRSQRPTNAYSPYDRASSGPAAARPAWRGAPVPPAALV